MKVFTHKFHDDNDELVTVEVKLTKKGITVLEPDMAQPLTDDQAEGLAFLLEWGVKNTPNGPFVPSGEEYPNTKHNREVAAHNKALENRQLLAKVRRYKRRGFTNVATASKLGITESKVRYLLRNS